VIPPPYDGRRKILRFCPSRTFAGRVVESLLTKDARELEKRWKAVA